jgi:hypothetical protein
MSEWLAFEVVSPRWTFLCRRRLLTTEKWRPHPSTSQANGFSPVWLYMCVCNELGRVKRLSQILHLCFFWVFADILEENCPIIACGAGGPRGRPIIWLGRGKVRDAAIDSYPASDAAEL